MIKRGIQAGIELAVTIIIANLVLVGVSHICNKKVIEIR